MTAIERKVASKFKEIDKIIKNSFGFIRGDIEDLQSSVEAMRKYLKKKDKQYEYAGKEDNKIRDEFRRDVDDFSQQISQLNLALERVEEVEKTVVLKKDLAQIEDSIRNDFRNVIGDIRDEGKEIGKRVKYLEAGKVREKKGFFKRIFGGVGEDGVEDEDSGE